MVSNCKLLYYCFVKTVLNVLVILILINVLVIIHLIHIIHIINVLVVYYIINVCNKNVSVNIFDSEKCSWSTLWLQNSLHDIHNINHYY